MVNVNVSKIKFPPCESLVNDGTPLYYLLYLNKFIGR